MNILTIENLSKSFGSRKIIDNLAFSVPEHTIYGFLGQNGAGKTTTMKMILGLLKPDGGRITVCGEEVRYGETKTNRYIGYLPDVPEFYGFMKPYEYLALCGEITGFDRRKIKDKSEELLSLVGLVKENKRIGGFSRGMKQRLGIAQALLNEPRLLICDEPTSALDPVGRKEILDIMLSVRERTTIVFSTHILSDVERICDHVAVLHKGSLALNGTLADLKQNRKRNYINIEFASNADAKRFIADEAVRKLLPDTEGAERMYTVKSDNIEAAQQELFDAFAALKIYPEKVEVAEPTLEGLFMEVIR